MSIIMQASAVSARPEPDSCAADLAAARFAADCRPAVARLCREGRPFRDLATSFPAMLHRIAMRPQDRGADEAAAILRDGGPLKRAAVAAGVPSWTRRLPPEAFGRSSPDFPDGPAFARSIANFLPRRKTASSWLACVFEAARWGEDGFTLWTARECARDPLKFAANRIPLMALHAWYSNRPDLPGGAIAAERWSPKLKAGAALARARAWLEAVELAVNVGSRDLDPWLAAGHVDGYDFTPLVSGSDLLDEASAMDNCLKTYGPYIAHNHERIWSVRRDGGRVATLSVAFPEDAPFPQILQLKGRRNGPVPAEVWFAARRWLANQTPPRPATIPWDRAELDRSAWIAIWRPYWLARRVLPAQLPLRPSQAVLDALERGGPRRLARRRRRA